jgi:uncharacterized membrane protein
MSDANTALTLVTAIGCGLVGGVFFAFSTFVMQGLDRLRPGAAVAAMQEINRTAVTPAFMTLLFGTALLCLVVAVVALTELGESGAVLRLAGAAVYLLGTIAVTMFFNVPRNNELEAADPAAADAESAWSRYYSIWVRWNHVRTVASTAAAVGLVAAML